MTQYILKGDPAEIEKIIRENRIRIDRGGVIFTPVDTPEEPVPEEPASVETEEPEARHVADDKHIELEDLTKVDLDTDDKATDVSDTKENPAEDSKEAVPAPKTSRRAKKSE